MLHERIVFCLPPFAFGVKRPAQNSFHCVLMLDKCIVFCLHPFAFSVK
jgi:hypothetical protein